MAVELAEDKIHHIVSEFSASGSRTLLDLEVWKGPQTRQAGRSRLIHKVYIIDFRIVLE